MIITDDKDKIIKAYKKEQVEYTNKFIDMQEEIERLNNDIKELLKENSNKEKVIIAQDNIINKAIEYIRQLEFESEELYDISEIARLELLEILKGVGKE